MFAVVVKEHLARADARYSLLSYGLVTPIELGPKLLPWLEGNGSRLWIARWLPAPDETLLAQSACLSSPWC